METNLTKISDVEFEFEIRAPAEDLKPELDKALKMQRSQTQAKGFRPGKVPISLVRKLYGEALAFGVAEKHVQQIYETQILENDDYDLVGQPTLTELDYKLDTDLRAVIRFGTRPAVELADLSSVTVEKLKVDVSEEDLDEQLESFRRSRADLTPTDEPAGDEDQIIFDLQELDLETDAPIIGRRDEGREMFLDDEMPAAWKEALHGRKAGDNFRADIPHGEGEHSHIHRYDITVHEVKNRELPELTDESVAELTDGNMETVDELRDRLKEELSRQVDEQSRSEFESMIVEKVLDLHAFPVPAQAVDLYLDSFVQDVKRRNEDKLPEDFDETAFRERTYPEAEKQARWMFIRDQIIELNSLSVSDEEIDAHFEEMSTSDELPAEMMRRYYDQLGMTDNLSQQLLSRKVFAWLADQIQVEELEYDAYVEAMQARNEASADQPADDQSIDDQPLPDAEESAADEGA